jgi:HSP20 family protein
MTTLQNQNATSHDPRAERLNRRPQLTAAVDVFEGRDDYLIQADVPGAGPDDVDVHFERGSLQLTARVKQPESMGGAREFEWTRAFALPGSVDAERIAAELRDGVLTVKLPRKDALKPRQISVKAG